MIRIILTALYLVAFNVNAAVVSVDWKTAGDNLVTRDTGSGLFWLDLTETNNMSYDYVKAELGSGGQFSGWRVATGLEVVGMFASFGIDLSNGVPNQLPGLDPAVEIATNYLGNIVIESYPPSQYPYGVLGVTSDIISGFQLRMGAVQSIESTNRTYYHSYGDPNNSYGSYIAEPHTGTFLVRTSLPPVPGIPVPAAVWLFGSGLIALIGLARRKKIITK